MGFIDDGEMTPAMHRVLHALWELARVHDADVVARLAATVLQRRRQEVWGKRGYKESGGRLCVMRLVGKRCDYRMELGRDTDEHAHRPPEADHDTLYIKDGKPAVFLTQPYDLSWQGLQDLVAFCQKHGMEARINARDSWHFPGDTIAVIVTPAGAKPRSVMGFREQVKDWATGDGTERGGGGGSV